MSLRDQAKTELAKVLAHAEWDELSKLFVGTDGKVEYNVAANRTDCIWLGPWADSDANLDRLAVGFYNDEQCPKLPQRHR
jgi:hypothetical protein